MEAIDYYADERMLALAELEMEKGKFPLKSESWIAVDTQVRKLRLEMLTEYQTRGNA